MIYTFGHGRKSVTYMKQLLPDNYVIVDIRYKPFTRAPGWSKHELQREFGKNYIWLREWGNVDYKSNHVRLLNFEAGLKVIDGLLADGKIPVLLCSCSNYKTCHRATIATKLALNGYNVRELDALQMNLF